VLDISKPNMVVYIFKIIFLSWQNRWKLSWIVCHWQAYPTYFGISG
jgi:hypothetical protein